MKKFFLIAAAACIIAFTACGESSTTNTESSAVVSEDEMEQFAEIEEAVELSVVTTYAGEDGYAEKFRQAVQSWEVETGCKVKDNSQISDENFKNKVITDFETGMEPDVLFFFTGADADAFIRAGKVISLEEIREEYPEYGANMDDDKIPASPIDGERYALPVNGFWEAMFVNTEVLYATGISMPDENYTWEQFLEDCEIIKNAGYTPIACALGDIPHYWWEFCIFNHTDIDTHTKVPISVEYGNGAAWVEGIKDIMYLYEQGYFPENTFSASDSETSALFVEGKAAFMIDGSWRVNTIASAFQSDPNDPSTLDEEKLDKISITYVPSNNESRKTTDLIGGISSGYYITRRAWNNPEKRAAAVNFVEYMTSTEVISDFAGFTSTALRDDVLIDESTYNSLQSKAVAMMAGCTSITSAVQDVFNGDCRASTFDGLRDILEGHISPEEAVQKGLDIYHK